MSSLQPWRDSLAMPLWHPEELGRFQLGMGRAVRLWAPSACPELWKGLTGRGRGLMALGGNDSDNWVLSSPTLEGKRRSSPLRTNFHPPHLQTFLGWGKTALLSRHDQQVWHHMKIPGTHLRCISLRSSGPQLQEKRRTLLLPPCSFSANIG